MKDSFLADECVWRSLIEDMRGRGWKVRSVREICQGAEDRDVLETALSAEEILITEDSDFGDLVFLEGKPTFWASADTIRTLPAGGADKGQADRRPHRFSRR